MTAQKNPNAEKTLPPRLRKLLNPDQRMLSVQVAQGLSAQDVLILRELIRQRTTRPDDVSLSRAISALAVRDRTAETASVLGSFARDEGEASVDRAAAAAGLRLIAAPEARDGLVELLSSPDVIVRAEATRSLGCIGDVATLRALDEIYPMSAGPDDQRLSFARALIAHRIGLEEDHVPFRDGIARRAHSKDQLIQLSLRPIRPRTTAADRERLQGSDYGIPLSARVAFRLSAGRAQWTVLVNGELTEGSGAFARSSRIFDRPWITALLARIDQPTKSSAVQYVVLSDPEVDGARIMVVRTDGELMYSGHLTRTEGLLRFVVRDIARKGTAPTNISGHLTTRGVEFDVSIPFGRRKDVSAGRDVVGSR